MLGTKGQCLQCSSNLKSRTAVHTQEMNILNLCTLTLIALLQ